jgi:endonuclease YncB( thermonuclease family)
MKWVAALLACIALAAQAETFSARVIFVIDGDTLMAIRGGQKIKVRLANIDAPEIEQPSGMESRDSLREMAGKRQVQIDSLAVDQYGRSVGLVYAEGRNLNLEQLKRGMAWAYSRNRDSKTYIDLQNEARQAGVGLWGQGESQAPWEWRKLHPTTKPLRGK